jgi:hypothetical protein
VDEVFCQNLTERALKVNEAHGISADVDCYKKISWFLQHCTDHRYRVKRSWDIAGMFADFRPILDDFEASVTPAVKEVEDIITLSKADYGTATMTKTGPLLPIEDSQRGVRIRVVLPKK